MLLIIPLIMLNNWNFRRDFLEIFIIKIKEKPFKFIFERQEYQRKSNQTITFISFCEVLPDQQHFEKQMKLNLLDVQLFINIQLGSF